MFLAARDLGHPLRIFVFGIQLSVDYRTIYDSKIPTCLSYVRTGDEIAHLDGYIDGRKNGHRAPMAMGAQQSF